MDIIDFFLQNPNLWLLLLFVFGLCIGSFLNVLIYRLPIMLQEEWQQQCTEALNLPNAANENWLQKFNLFFPRSHCPQCKEGLRAWMNIPLLSYFLLQRRCHFCHHPISARYPMVELLSGLLALTMGLHFGVSLAAVAASIFAWFAVALIFIDMDTLLLPDHLTLSLMWLGLLFNTQHLFTNPGDAILGAAVGYSVLWIIAKIFYFFAKIEGMGYGDFKLTAAIGAWLGWQLLPIVILTGSLIALVVGGFVLIFKKLNIRTYLPFGPFLSMGGLIALIWGRPLLLWYMQAFSI